MADAAPAATPAPAVAPANGAQPPPKPGKPAPVVEVRPKPAAAAPPPGERVVEFTDHNGQKHSMTEKQLAAYVLRGQSTQKTLTEWDQKRLAHEKEVEKFNAKVERLKSDPSGLKAFLAELGADPRKVGQSLVLEEIEEGKLSEDQKALREERRKREELEAKQKEREDQEAEQKHAAEVEQHYQELSTLFLDSLQQADIPEQMAPVLFPQMARLYRAAKRANMQVEPSMFAQHLAGALDELVAQRAATTPLEKLESLIGKRKWKPSDDAEETELDYAEIVHRRKLAALRAKRAGVPGVAAAPVATSNAGAGAISLPGEVVRSMSGDMQNAYWAMQRASAEELPGKRQRFEAMARRAGVKI